MEDTEHFQFFLFVLIWKDHFHPGKLIFFKKINLFRQRHFVVVDQAPGLETGIPGMGPYKQEIVDPGRIKDKTIIRQNHQSSETFPTSQNRIVNTLVMEENKFFLGVVPGIGQDPELMATDSKFRTVLLMSRYQRSVVQKFQLSRC
jgi:hypothetical protein